MSTVVDIYKRKKKKGKKKMNKKIIKKKIIEKLFAKFSILNDEREKEEFERELQNDFENLEKTMEANRKT
jgi:hypothetical protein